MSKKTVVVMQVPENLSLERAQLFFLEVQPSLQADRARLVLDCSRMHQLDSAGIRVLLRCLEEAMKRNGDVKLAAIPSSVAKILALTQVDSLYETFETIADAVESFNPFPVFMLEQQQPGVPTVASESAT